MPKPRKPNLNALLDWPNILERAKKSTRGFCFLERILTDLFEGGLLIAWEVFLDESGYWGGAHLLPDGRVVRISVSNYSVLYGGWWHFPIHDDDGMPFPDDPKKVTESCQRVSEPWYVLPNLAAAIAEVSGHPDDDPEDRYDDDSAGLLRDHVSFLDFLIRAKGMSGNPIYESFLNHKVPIKELLNWVESEPSLQVGSLEARELLEKSPEWHRFPPIHKMLNTLRKPVHYRRKVRLFAAACLRRVAHIFQDSGNLHWLEALEDFADKQYPEQKLKGLREDAKELQKQDKKKWSRFARKSDYQNPVPTSEMMPVRARIHALSAFLAATDKPRGCIDSKLVAYNIQVAVDPLLNVEDITQHALDYYDPLATSVSGACERVAQTHLVRDIFFDSKQSPPEMNKAWLTSSVRALAEAIYENHTFGDMPILADALEEAGCTNEIVLSHCRCNPIHARGCWVLDGILGKE